jgi:threonine/homoserine/homoserine lactone efflux protein
VAGDAYILWLGIQLWRKPASTRQRVAQSGSAFFAGRSTFLSNPKLILFFGSILALVFDPHLPAWTRLAALVILAANELAWYSFVIALFSTNAAQAA